LREEWEKRRDGQDEVAERVGERERAGFPRLLRFQGRSKDLTPKARVLQMLGKVYPEKYG
jgi:cytochrome c heme-lyase